MQGTRRRTLTLAYLWGFLALAATPAAAETLTVVWEPPNASVAGYVVYVGTRSGVYSGSYDVGNATSFTYKADSTGQTYYFAVAAYAPGPLIGNPSPEVSVVAGITVPTNAPPTLANPGNQGSTTGQPVSLQLAATDPQGQPVSYGANPLPPGLSLTPATGFISGTPTVAGTYPVTATATDGSMIDAESFTWTVAAPAIDRRAPAVTITVPTSVRSFATSKTSVMLGGTAFDDGAVTAVDWFSDRGAQGQATGTERWIAAVPLQRGQNRITVRARDASGNVTSRTITIKSSYWPK